MKLQTLKPRIAMLEVPKRQSVNEMRARGSQRKRGKAGMQQRERILLRDKFTCQCGCGRLGAPHQLEVDHRIPLFAGGNSDDSNMQTLLIECHARKTARELSDVAKCRRV
jgi:5-methylcytosine-specific restriction protein A